jgi:hypothetical protein
MLHSIIPSMFQLIYNRWEIIASKNGMHAQNANKKCGSFYSKKFSLFTVYIYRYIGISFYEQLHNGFARFQIFKTLRKQKHAQKHRYWNLIAWIWDGRRSFKPRFIFHKLRPNPKPDFHLGTKFSCPKIYLELRWNFSVIITFRQNLPPVLKLF